MRRPRPSRPALRLRVAARAPFVTRECVRVLDWRGRPGRCEVARVMVPATDWSSRPAERFGPSKSSPIVACLLAFSGSGLVFAQGAVPAELRNGSATLEQAKAWVATEVARMLPGSPPPEIAVGAEQPDVDQDGTPDLLIEHPGLGGTGGAVYSAFLTTPTGYRYIGGLLGSLVPVERVRGEAPRILIRTRLGADCAIVELMELGPDGMRRVGQKALTATNEGIRNHRALLGQLPASADAVQAVFGKASELESLLTDVVDVLPGWSLTELTPGCTGVSAAYETGTPRGATMRISITTYATPEEASGFVARRRSSAPGREETLASQTVFASDVNDRSRLIASLGPAVVALDGATSSTREMTEAMTFLLDRLPTAPR